MANIAYRCGSVWILTTSVLGMVASASPRYELVAASRLQAPGTGPGTTFGILGPPSMNVAGQVVFNATLNSASTSSDSGLWLNDTLVARAGDAAPGGVPGLRFRVFDYTSTPVINDAGTVAFSARPLIPGVEFASGDMSIWVGKPGSLELVAMAGRTAPDLDATALYRFGVEIGGGVFPFASPSALVLTESGRVVFWAEVDDSEGRHHALYAGLPSSPGLVARAHRQAEGLPSNVRHELFHRIPLGDGVGNVFFSSTLGGSGVTPLVNDSALYVGSADGVRLLVREDGPVAAVPGARWAGNWSIRLNESGQLLFTDELDGVPADTRNALWIAEPHEAPQLLARAGQPAPGASGRRFGGGFRNIYIDDSGRAAFTVRADPIGSTLHGPNGLWTGTRDDLELVLLEGDAAPGGPAGSVISQIREPAVVNANGMVAFAAYVRGDGVTASNDEALFAGVPGELQMLVREGDEMEVAPGDVRGVVAIRFGASGTVQYHEHLINDSNQVVVALGFADGSQAIYRITVPEPVVLPLFSASLLLLRRRRRGG